ncbi:hypothetical protein HOY82DRAFT_73278 [Tuber indicum]|nr:hypothetical protein HOY82DRAFT_73278 [Tuber indicum]
METVGSSSFPLRTFSILFLFCSTHTGTLHSPLLFFPFSPTNQPRLLTWSYQTLEGLSLSGIRLASIGRISQSKPLSAPTNGFVRPLLLFPTLHRLISEGERGMRTGRTGFGIRWVPHIGDDQIPCTSDHHTGAPKGSVLTRRNVPFQQLKNACRHLCLAHQLHHTTQPPPQPWVRVLEHIPVCAIGQERRRLLSLSLCKIPCLIVNHFSRSWLFCGAHSTILRKPGSASP